MDDHWLDGDFAGMTIDLRNVTHLIWCLDRQC